MIPGRSPAPGQRFADQKVRQELLDPTLQAVFASDSRGTSTGPIRGAIIDATTHAIVDLLGTRNAGGIFSTSEAGPQFAQVSQPIGTSAIALSGFRQEVAFFAERDEEGHLLQQIRVFDFDLGQSITKPILGKIKFTNIAAVTYLPEDDSYYFLDRTKRGHKSTITLLQLPRGLTLHKMAEWHDSHRFRDFALTSGSGGSLVVSASSDHRHAICVLSNDAEKIHGRAMFFGNGPIVVPHSRISTESRMSGAPRTDRFPHTR